MKFTYVVTNVGDVPLHRLSVVDNVVGAISCPRTSLGVGQSMERSPTTMVVEVGGHSMKSCVSGYNAGRKVSDCDPVHFEGVDEEHPPGKIGDKVFVQAWQSRQGGQGQAVRRRRHGNRGKRLDTTYTNVAGMYWFSPGPGCYQVVFVGSVDQRFVGGSRYLTKHVCIDAGETDNTVDAVLR